MKLTYFIFAVLIILIAKPSSEAFSSRTFLELFVELNPIIKAPILGLLRLLASIGGVQIVFYA